MGKNNQVDDIRSFVNSIDLDSISELIDYASLIPIPGMKVICKVLTMLLKLMKPFQTITKSVVSSNKVVSTSAVPDAEAKINALIDLAYEDGVLTDAEKSFILDKAAELGIDRDVVELKLKSREI
ncbi:MAG: hypothetical protein MJZ19_09240 [Paludibacteraceae bacterium]|nr:hypothetical protein [Paludibacteraceae bacterium]